MGADFESCTRLRAIDADVLEQTSSLYVRAYIRHRFTSYHDDLDSLSPEHSDEEYLSREVRGAANEAVNRFLFEHRLR